MKNLFCSLPLLCFLFFASAASAQEQAKIDDGILKAYFAKHHIKAKKMPSGLCYIILKKGQGMTAKPGQLVGVNYMGKLLDGTLFDANVDVRYQTLPGRKVYVFPLGGGKVIKGWEEGFQLLNKGARARLFLPSHLAYGPRGRQGVPPNSIFVFDVELVSVEVESRK